MDVYRCVAYCNQYNPGGNVYCLSSMFYPGPLSSGFWEPTKFCVAFLVDLDSTDSTGSQLFDTSGSGIWADLPSYSCPSSANCDECEYQSSGGVSACKLREFLKTKTWSGESAHQPLPQRTGSVVHFMNQMGTRESLAFELQSELTVKVQSI